MHKITIEQVDGTYIVEIGCKHHIFMTVDALISDVAAYIEAPTFIESKWHDAKKYIRDKEESQVKCHSEVQQPPDVQQRATCEGGNSVPVPPPGLADGIR